MKRRGLVTTEVRLPLLSTVFTAHCRGLRRSARQTRASVLLLTTLVIIGNVGISAAQTTYHLHDDSSGIQLRTTNPDTSAVVIVSPQDIKGLSPGDFIIAQFPTPAGVPGTAGVILSGSTVTFTLWMSATSTGVSSFPEATLYVDSVSGTKLCSNTGATALTTTLAKYVLSCTTSSNVYFATSDTLLLWVGFHTAKKSTSSLKGQLGVEGTFNGSDDSTVVVPAMIPPPSISSLSITSGSPGTAVTISGSNFGSSQGSSTVTFNGTAASVSSWAPGSIGVTVPGSTTGSVVITVNGQGSNGITFAIPTPTITSVSPTSGRYGTAVTITGSSFGLTQAAGSSTVSFGSTAASPTSWSDGSISVPVPNGAAGGVVSLTVKVGPQSTSTNFTVIPPPSITSLSPNSGPINMSVTVSGSGFGSPQGSSTITFNGTTATPFSWGPGSIVVPVPSGTTTGPVVVTVAGQGSTGVTFTVTGGPSINTGGLSPSSGPAGTAVTITGSNFGGTQGNSVVNFNGLAAKVTSWASGTIHAVAPVGVSTGPVTVTVSGQTSNGVTFTAITTGTLSGTVTNSSNAAVSGASVQVLQNGASKGSAATSSTGTYSIASLPAGTYDIQASASGLGTALQNAVSISANQTTTQNFTLSSPGGITGKVTQSDGVTAIFGASVQVFVGSGTASSTSTDSNGNYSVSSLNAGSYRTQVSATGFVTKSQSVSVSGGTNATANFSLQSPGTAAIQYEYDELGRLVGVVDTAGDSASYQYDPVGNILSIGRQASNQVSIFNFTPKTGTSGTTVTINGAGFSATASQDTVQFNGTNATVLNATSTQITASVPTGATTGPIKVIAPNGTATSSAGFTVAAPSGSPTITSFTPTSGTAGTTITVTGTNFDPTLANNKLVVNATNATTNTLTGTTQVTTPFPATTSSGHISISTPNGAATSTQDFYTPCCGHAVSSIGYTGRVSMGGSQTVSLPTSGTHGLLLFDGVAGHGLSLTLSGSTFSTCTLYIIAPNGSKVLFENNTQNSSNCTSSTTSVTSIPLLTTGTYTIAIDPAGATGSVTIGATADAEASISIDGPPVTVTTTQVGQDAHLTFNVIAGQRIVVFATNVTNNGADVYWVAPDGTLEPNSGVLTLTSTPGATFFMDTQTLTETGQYQLWVLHSFSGFGSETLQIASVPPDVNAGTLTIPAPGSAGPTATLTTTKAGQNGYFTFSGTAGQQISLNISNNSYGNQCLWTLSDPTGRSVASEGCPTSFVDPQTIGGSLKQTGTYTLLIDPQGPVTGASTWSINNDADVTGTISIDGPTITPSTTVAGQDARLSFSATAGQQIVVFETNATNPGQVSLVNPSGTNQASVGSSGFMDTQPLSTTGTYQLWVQHLGTHFGNATLQISSVPPDVTGSATVNGAGVSFTTVVGQNAEITFSNPQSQSVTVHWSSGSGMGYPSSPGCNMFITGPSPSTSPVASGNCAGASGSFTTNTLAQGTYNIQVNPAGASTGGLTLTVTNP